MYKMCKPKKKHKRKKRKTEKYNWVNTATVKRGGKTKQEARSPRSQVSKKGGGKKIEGHHSGAKKGEHVVGGGI